MRGWIKNTIVTILVVSVAFAIYKLAGNGNNLTGMLNGIWNVFYTIVNAISNVLVHAYHTVFGGK